MNFLFHEIPTKHIPFDFDTFYKSNQKLVVVTTDCNSGKPYYIDDFEENCLMESLKATTSLPFAQKIINLNNLELLDGGIVDSIPYKKAFEDGYDKLVVVLTQPKGYRKERSKLEFVAKLLYRNYPKLFEAINSRYKQYNRAVEELEQLEKEGKVLIIRPDEKLPISRTEKDKEKLKRAFEIGYNQWDYYFPKLKKFCSLKD